MATRAKGTVVTLLLATPRVRHWLFPGMKFGIYSFLSLRSPVWALGTVIPLLLATPRVSARGVPRFALGRFVVSGCWGPYFLPASHKKGRGGRATLSIQS